MGPFNAKKPKMSSLEQLKKLTIVVADTGDFEGEFTTESVGRTPSGSVAIHLRSVRDSISRLPQ